MVEGRGEEVSFLVDPVIKMCTWSPIEEMITGCLEVSGGPARLLRASRHDMGCLEVSGGPARLLRASRHDLKCLEVSGGPGGVWRPCATPEGL